jgi:hypothetical protein
MLMTDGEIRPSIEKLPKKIEDKLRGENILLGIKGAFREWLICTNTKVYIYKKGFMTGHLFGYNSFQLPYRNISSVQVNKHLMTGYFEVSSGGVQNTNKSYWLISKNISAQRAPNCISLINISGLFEKFTKACDFINQKVYEQSNPQEASNQRGNAPDIPDQIKKLAVLRDQGILTENEFAQKKTELLAKL